MTQKVGVSTLGWAKKSTLLKQCIAREMPRIVNAVGDQSMKEVIKNVSGPGIKPGISGAEDDRIGKMPIPRRTGYLAKSIKRKSLSFLMQIIYSDPKVASYNKKVHDGTPFKTRGVFIEPRPFIGNVVQTYGAIWRKQSELFLRDKIRTIGRD